MVSDHKSLGKNFSRNIPSSLNEHNLNFGHFHICNFANSNGLMQMCTQQLNECEHAISLIICACFKD